MNKLRILTIATAMAALSALGLAAAHADTDFGTGNSSKGPQDPASVCSPSPNLDADLAQCK